jgi:hypothetical protein
MLEIPDEHTAESMLRLAHFPLGHAASSTLFGRENLNA